MAVERFITESGSLSLEQMGSQTSPVRVYFVVALDESPQISCEVQFAEESGLGNVESLVCPYVSSIEGEHFYSCTYKPLLYLYLTGDENNQDSDLCIQNNTTVTFVDNKFILNGETVHGRFALNFGEYNLVVHSQHPLRLIDNDTSKIRITGQFTHTNGSSNIGYYGNVVISVYEDFGTISYECTKHGAMGGTNNLIFNTQCQLGEPIIPTPTPSPSATPSPSVTLDSGPQGPSGDGYTFSTKADLQTAVNAWDADSTSAESTYGNINNWNVSAITNMEDLFSSKTNITSLDLSGWDTSNVTNMNSMFYSCSALTSLDVSSFDTSNVTQMLEMFRTCSSLTTLDVSDWDTSKVTNMGYMFVNCYVLSNIDMSSWCVSGFESADYTHWDGTYNWDNTNLTEQTSISSENLPNWGYCPVTGVISGATNIGDDTLIVSNSAEFTIGDQLVIDRGTSSEETTTIIDKGSLVIYPALTKSHADTATVESRPALPSPTPSPSVTLDSGPSPTPSPSPSPTPSPSPSPTPSPSVTPSPSPSVTPSPSPSPTPSPTESPTYVETYIDGPSPTPSPTESPTYVETYIDGPSPTPSPTESPTYVETYIDGPSGPQGELLFNVESVELRDVYSSSQSLYEGLNTDPLPGDYFSALVLNNFTINEDSSFYDSLFPQSGYGGGYEYASSGPIGGGYASLSYGFIIHKKDVTLTDEEIAVAHEDLYNGIDSLNYIMGTPTIGDLNENIVLETLSDNNESTDYIKSVNGSNYAGIVYPRTTAYLSGESPSDLKQDIGQVDALVFNNLVDGDDLGATIFIVSESTNEDSSILYRQAFPINKISGSITSSINELAIDIDLESDNPTNESSVTVQSITGEESGVYTLYYDEVNDPSVSVTYLVSLRTSDTDDDYENGGLEITLTSEVVRPRIELHQSDTLYVGYLTNESGTGINYLDLQMTTHGPSGPQGDTETPTPSPSATETPTPIPFNMETVDFTDPDLIFYVSVSNIQGAYSNNGKTLVGNFNQNDNTQLSNVDGLILGNTTSSVSYMNHLRYVIQVDLIHPETFDIKTWASSFDASVQLSSDVNSLGSSYNVPGFIFFGTKTDASQFDGYILHDIKIDERTKTSSSYSGAEFTLNLYAHSSSSNQYNGVKLGSLLYTTSTCGTSTSPVTSYNNQAGYWWSVTSRSWDAN